MMTAQKDDAAAISRDTNSSSLELADREKLASEIERLLWSAIDLMAATLVQPDPRVWSHLAVYAPAALRQPAGVSEEILKAAILARISDCSTTDWYDIQPPGLENLAMLAAQAVLALNLPQESEQPGEVDAPLDPPHDDRLAAPDMTAEQVRQWIGVCNHEPARRVLWTYIVMLENGFMAHPHS